MHSPKARDSEILENIHDSKGDHLRSTEVTHIYQGRLHACRCKGLPHSQRYLQRHPHDYSWPLWLMEDYPSVELSRPMVHLILSFDSLKIILDSQWLMQMPLRSPDERLSEATGTGSSQINREPSQADGGSSKTRRWRTEMD